MAENKLLFTIDSKEKIILIYLHICEESVSQKILMQVMNQCHIPLLLYHRLFLQMQCYSDHIHHQYFQVLVKLFDFFFDLCRLKYKLN